MKRLIAAILRYRRFHYIDASNASDIARKKIEPELGLIKQLLDPAKAFFDVGANTGMYVYVASKYMSPSHIYAFEPQQQYIRMLKKLFPDVRVVRAALSSSAGAAQFKVPVIGGQEYAARGTLEHFMEVGEERARMQTVDTMTLDSAKTALASGAVGCIKIDVEGHEREVLMGAEGTLTEDRPSLIVEIEQRHHKEPIENIFSWIIVHGYKGFFWDPASAVLAPLSAFSVVANQRMEDFKTPAYVNNFIFTPHV